MTMDHHAATTPPTHGRETVGRVLLGISALVAGVTALPAATGADDATLIVVSWRALGFFVFFGILALLARRPRNLPGVFELAIAHKVAMTVVALSAARPQRPTTWRSSMRRWPWC
jgi:hypothetical protein